MGSSGRSSLLVQTGFTADKVACAVGQICTFCAFRGFHVE
ncbi:hypothetical protein FGIG_12534 [Fasciola gigantica]|uniref:Uncharacterized protein n=1 Tax=Fasciola gigantica TaxID=46835 RepID=A0A504YDA4_FASGI|nr:hypothetical protein FGIG_12534 [Fasciola gigantica]